MAVQDEVPKSRLTLRYKTEVNGAPADVDLPLRLLVLGDFSLGTSTDRKVDLEERKIRTVDQKGLTGPMKDMKIAIDFEVANKIDPANSENIAVRLPVESMKSFQPDEVARNIPKVRGLLLLKKLLLEAEANVSNVKDFRKMLSDLYASEEAHKKVMDELKGYEGYKLPTGKA